MSEYDSEITYEYKKGHLVASFRDREDDEVIKSIEDLENNSERMERDQGAEQLLRETIEFKP